MSTSAELTALNVFLFETPLPLVLFVGLYFAVSPVDDAPARLLFWWAGALVLVTGVFCVNVLVRILTRGRGASPL